MKKISFQEDLNLKNEENEIINKEFYSLKLTDSLYKKDICKFFEIISSHLISR